MFAWGRATSPRFNTTVLSLSSGDGFRARCAHAPVAWLYRCSDCRPVVRGSSPAASRAGRETQRTCHRECRLSGGRDFGQRCRTDCANLAGSGFRCCRRSRSDPQAADEDGFDFIVLRRSNVKPTTSSGNASNKAMKASPRSLTVRTGRRQGVAARATDLAAGAGAVARKRNGTRGYCEREGLQPSSALDRTRRLLPTRRSCIRDPASRKSASSCPSEN